MEYKRFVQAPQEFQTLRPYVRTPTGRLRLTNRVTIPTLGSSAGSTRPRCPGT